MMGLILVLGLFLQSFAYGQGGNYFIDLNAHCSAVTDQRKTNQSVRMFKCTNGVTAYDPRVGISTNSNADGFIQLLSKLYLTDVSTAIYKYYMGYETNPVTGAVFPGKVPVCNIMTGEGDTSSSSQNWLATKYKNDTELSHLWNCGDFCHINRSGRNVSLQRQRFDSNNIPRTCVREYALYRGIWAHYLWSKSYEVLEEILTQGRFEIQKIDGKSPCDGMISDIRAFDAQVNTVDATIRRTINTKNIPMSAVKCDRGSIYYKTTQQKVLKVEQGLDSNLDIIDENAVDGNHFSSQTVCLIEAIRTMQLQIYSKLAFCEANSRARGAFEQNYVEKIDTWRRVLERRLRNSCNYIRESRINSCYKNKIRESIRELYEQVRIPAEYRNPPMGLQLNPKYECSFAQNPSCS